MDIPSKTLKNGFSMPIYGYGTWKVGGWPGADRDEKKDKKAIESLKYALHAGVRHIDTAEMYANGHAEELIGEAIKGYQRTELFLTSKVKPNHMSYDQIITCAKNSLKRLGTDYLDLYLLHMPNPAIPIAQSMKALDTLVADGLVKHIGVSNFSKERLEVAQGCTRNTIVVDQVRYSLGFRYPESSGLLSYCQDHDVMLVAYTPLDHGLFVKKQFPLLEEMAKKYQKTNTQIALNWLMSQRNVVTISKTIGKEHLEENLEAVAFTMQQDDVERLRKEFPIQQQAKYLDYDISWYIMALGNTFTDWL